MLLSCNGSRLHLLEFFRLSDEGSARFPIAAFQNPAVVCRWCPIRRALRIRAVVLQCLQSLGELTLGQCLSSWRDFLRLIVGVTTVDAQGAAMGFQFLHVEQLQPVRLEDHAGARVRE